MRYPPKSGRASAAGSRTQRTVTVRPRSAIESAPACGAPGYAQIGMSGNAWENAAAGTREAMMSETMKKTGDHVARPRGAGRGGLPIIVELPVNGAAGRSAARAAAVLRREPHWMHATDWAAAERPGLSADPRRRARRSRPGRSAGTG